MMQSATALRIPTGNVPDEYPETQAGVSGAPTMKATHQACSVAASAAHALPEIGADG